jgi:glycosyltransferase involved in cell wall biosynthesis
LTEDRVSIIPHGVFSYYKELIRGKEGSYRLQNHLGLPGKKNVLFFGVLKPYKGIDILLEAFARLPEPIIRDTVLRIVGYPMMQTEPLKIRAQSLGIADRINWDLRFVEEIEVASYFAQADVVVLPYRRIDQSGVIMVALAFEKPIIASRVGGFAETITDGEHGLLVEPGDVGSLAQSLSYILSEDELRARMGVNIKELTSGALSWEAIASKTLGVYGKLKR